MAETWSELETVRAVALAATSNPLTQNMIDTIAVKHGWPTATLDGKRAYLQVPETKDVVVKPPKDWCTQPDYKPRTRWKTKTKWYGERDATQEWQEFLGDILVNHCGALRSRRNPTKYYVPHRQVYIDTHVDDGHMTGPARQQQALYDDCVKAGLDLKPAVQVKAR